MSDGQQRSAPGFVVLRQLPDGQWQLLGEVQRRRGLTSWAARSAAINEVTGGAARAGETYAAVLRSEWRIPLDWTSRSTGRDGRQV